MSQEVQREAAIMVELINLVPGTNAPEQGINDADMAHIVLL